MTSSGQGRSGESGHKADPQPIIERIRSELEKVGFHLDEDQEPPKQLNWDDPDDRRLVLETFGAEEFADQEPILPGFGPKGRGENARDDCGEDHPFTCDSCGHYVKFGRTCSQSVCTRCGVAWVRDLSIKKTAKLRRLRKEKNWHTPDAEHQKLHHQFINPSLGWYYHLARGGLSLEEAQDVTKEVVKLILDEMRAQGLLARHSFRGAREDGSIKSENDDRGLWKQRLNSDRAFYGDVRDDLAWRPHYHNIVVGDFLRGEGFTDKIEAKTGWVIGRIAGDDGVSIPNDAAMARVVTYNLSHVDIEVREGQHNRSAVWEVGSFQGDAFKSSSRFTATPADLQWADNVVRRVAKTTLGLSSGTTDCGATIPAVDEPDELARKILEELYPDNPEVRREIPADAVLHQVAQGNIRVSTSSLEGGGSDVTVGFGSSGNVGLAGRAGNLPTGRTGQVTVGDGGGEPVTPIVEDHEDGCDCDDHDFDVDRDGDDDQDGGHQCDGTLIPLGEARQRGLLEDDDWLRQAAHADEALEADQEWPEDLEPWRTSSPGDAIGAG